MLLLLLALTDLGLRIREIRGEMTQAEFASKLEVDRKTVVRWEAGERAPDGASLINMVQAFGVDANWLIKGEGLPPEKTLTPEEEAVVDAFRSSPKPIRDAVLAVLQVDQRGIVRGRATGSTSVRAMKIGAKATKVTVGQYSEGAITNSGPVHFGKGKIATKAGKKKNEGNKD